jgi:hypothetical protein
METVPEVSETISIIVMMETETAAETLSTNTAECLKSLESVIQCGLFKATNSGFYQPSNAEEHSQQHELPFITVLRILWTIFRRENINMPLIHDITDAMYIDVRALCFAPDRSGYVSRTLSEQINLFREKK